MSGSATWTRTYIMRLDPAEGGPAHPAGKVGDETRDRRVGMAVDIGEVDLLHGATSRTVHHHPAIVGRWRGRPPWAAHSSGVVPTASRPSVARRSFTSGSGAHVSLREVKRAP